MFLWKEEKGTYIAAPYFLFNTATPDRAASRSAIFDEVCTRPTSLGALQDTSWHHDLKSLSRLMCLIKGRKPALLKSIPKEIITMIVCRSIAQQADSLKKRHFMGVAIVAHLRKINRYNFTKEDIKRYITESSVAEGMNRYGPQFDENLFTYFFKYIYEQQSLSKKV